MLRGAVRFLVVTVLLMRWASAQSPTSRFSITTQNVLQALQSVEITVDASRIHLQAPMTATTPDPVLDVSLAGVQSSNVLRLRMACRPPGQCLPFFVLLETRDPGEAIAAQHALLSQVSTVPVALARSRPVLRVGQHTTFLLEDAHMRISLPVVSVDSGSAGAQIRVASLDGKQTYRGTITDEATVRGELH